VSNCKSCGAEIRWIKTLSGQSMPVDYTPVFYKAVPTATGKIITPGGATLSAEIVTDLKASVGYVPHWATCPAADSFRREKTCGQQS
jgi:hypothetical protein